MMLTGRTAVITGWTGGIGRAPAAAAQITGAKLSIDGGWTAA